MHRCWSGQDSKDYKREWSGPPKIHVPSTDLRWMRMEQVQRRMKIVHRVTLPEARSLCNGGSSSRSGHRRYTAVWSLWGQIKWCRDIAHFGWRTRDNPRVRRPILKCRDITPKKDNKPSGHMVHLNCDADGNSIDRSNQNSSLHTYEVEFPGGEITQLATNIIASLIFSLVWYWWEWVSFIGSVCWPWEEWFNSQCKGSVSCY